MKMELGCVKGKCGGAVVAAMVFTACSAPLVAVAAPPEEVPQICAKTICVLVVPDASARVVGYSSTLEARTGKQMITARLSTGVMVTVVSRPFLAEIESGGDFSGFEWERKSENTWVTSSCALCFQGVSWVGQGVGIAIHGADYSSVTSFVDGGGVRLWSINYNGRWNGEWRAVALGPKFRVKFPVEI